MTKRRILLIDDEKSFTGLVKLYLEDTGRYDVREENRGTAGLAAAREFRPNLVLLDIIMPDVDGGTLAGQLRADPQLQQIPVIFLTAIVSKSEIGKQAAVIGSNPFIVKPASMEVVMACIDKELREAADATSVREGRGR